MNKNKFFFFLLFSLKVTAENIADLTIDEIIDIFCYPEKNISYKEDNLIGNYGLSFTEIIDLERLTETENEIRKLKMNDFFTFIKYNGFKFKMLVRTVRVFVKKTNETITFVTDIDYLIKDYQNSDFYDIHEMFNDLKNEISKIDKIVLFDNYDESKYFLHKAIYFYKEDTPHINNYEKEFKNKNLFLHSEFYYPPIDYNKKKIIIHSEFTTFNEESLLIFYENSFNYIDYLQTNWRYYEK